MSVIIWFTIGILLGLWGGPALTYLISFADRSRSREILPRRRRSLSVDEIIEQALGDTPRIPRQGGKHAAEPSN